jgi:tetratricopeptide (TPR) repeat protein
MDRKDTKTEAQRLDSWKEIAAFFGRDERTVKRWEKERGLPIHRLPGAARSPVFAYPEELARWSGAPGAAEAVVGVAAAEPAQQPEPTPAPTSPRSRPFPLVKSPQIRWIIALAAVLVSIAALIVWRELRTPAQHAAHVPNREAEQLYLSGRYYWNRRTPEDLNKAVDSFTQAIVKDPAYAQAYAGLADVYNLLSEYSSMPYQEAFTRAIPASRRAVELDDSLAGAHCSLAFASFYGAWDRRTAEHEFKRALDLDPKYVTAHHWFATTLMTMGKFQDALREIERAQQLDPPSISILADKGLILWYAGRKNDALALLKQIAASEPSFVSTHRYLAAIYLLEKDDSNFLSEASKLAMLSYDGPGTEVADEAAKGFAASGRRGMLTSMLEVQERLFAGGGVPAHSVAVTCALLGENSKALEYLRRAIEKREIVVLTLMIDPAFEGMRGDAAFRALLERVWRPVGPTF